jgi:hypothetical protein
MKLVKIYDNLPAFDIAMDKPISNATYIRNCL